MKGFRDLFQRLEESGVRFIVVGGVAATIHGASRLTEDIDIVYERTPENFQRLVAALGPLAPYLRGAPPGLPFRWDERTLANGCNFTLMTTMGPIDLLGEITGGGRHEDLLPDAVPVQIFELTIRCLSLDKLIAVKTALGRPKDFEAIAELESLRRRRGNTP